VLINGVQVDHLDLQLLLTQNPPGGKLQASRLRKAKLAQQIQKTNGPKVASSHLRQLTIVQVVNLGVGSKADLIWVPRENRPLLQSLKRATGEILLEPDQVPEVIYPVSAIYCY
jgi:hypothetical protein